MANYDPYGIHFRLDTADGDDDEFNDASIAAAYTQVNPTGSVTWAEANHVLSAVFSGQSANDASVILKEMTLADGEAIETRIKTIAKKLTNFTMTGLVITDGVLATSKAIAFVMYHDNVANELAFEVRTGTLTNLSTAASAFLGDNGSVSGGIRIRLKRNSATSFTGLIGTDDGAQFNTFGLGNADPTFTPTHAGLMVSAWGGTNTGMAAFDYLRVTPP